jgi:peptidoglycan/LPS O-acetylase OafA/YrhL
MTAPWEGGGFEERAPNLTPPPGNPRFSLFDGLRGIAALSVFAGHTVTNVLSLRAHPALFLWAVTLSNQGVVIFFLISGFLLYRPFLQARRDRSSFRLGSYAKRRFLRIVPAYWMALTIFVLAGVVPGVTAHNWWIFYGFGQIYRSNLIGDGIGAAWTLCIEVTFYAALPLFALVAGRTRLGQRPFTGDVLLLVVCSAGSLAFRAHYSSFLFVAKDDTLPGTFLWFALGMSLAVISLAFESRIARLGLNQLLGRGWPLISWSAAVGLFVLDHHVLASPSAGPRESAIANYVLPGLTALCIVLPGVLGEEEGGRVRGVLRSRPLAWVGLVSYAFYLYHPIIINQLAHAARDLGLSTPYLPVTLVALPVSLVCASLSFYLLERPLMLLGRRRRSDAAVEVDKIRE